MFADTRVLFDTWRPGTKHFVLRQTLEQNKDTEQDTEQNLEHNKDTEQDPEQNTKQNKNQKGEEGHRMTHQENTQCNIWLENMCVEIWKFCEQTNMFKTMLKRSAVQFGVEPC